MWSDWIFDPSLYAEIFAKIFHLQKPVCLLLFCLEWLSETVMQWHLWWSLPFFCDFHIIIFFYLHFLQEYTMQHIWKHTKKHNRIYLQHLHLFIANFIQIMPVLFSKCYQNHNSFNFHRISVENCKKIFVNTT